MSEDTRESRLRELLAGLTRKDVSGLAVDDDIVRVLNLDSLGGLRMLAAIEKRFEIRFPDERLSELRTVSRILTAIAEAGPREG
jgi:acyl carrier protein